MMVHRFVVNNSYIRLTTLQQTIIHIESMKNKFEFKTLSSDTLAMVGTIS